MTYSVSEHHLQIAREVENFGNYKIAEFFYGESQEMLCSAWFQSPNIRKIQVYNDWISVEKAHAASVAISMAIEWLTEQGASSLVQPVPSLGQGSDPSTI